MIAFQDGINALHHAIRYDHLEVIQYFVEQTKLDIYHRSNVCLVNFVGMDFTMLPDDY
jgi:hypothetical protein